MKKKAPEPKKAKSKPAPKPSKPKQSAAPITGMVAKLRDQCKKAGLTYQHVFMKRKDDAGRTELLEQILADAGLSLRSDASAVAKVRKQKELEKDLDGIDTSAIIEGGRRRRAAAANGWGEKIDYATLNGKGKREKFGSDDDTTDNESSEDDDDDEDDSDVEVAVTSDEEDEGRRRGRRGERRRRGGGAHEEEADAKIRGEEKVSGRFRTETETCVGEGDEAGEADRVDVAVAVADAREARLGDGAGEARLGNRSDAG
jgi:hypothetical protein